MMVASFGLKAQRLAVSTNLLEYALLSPNLEVDLSLNQHNSISISGSASPWKVNEKYSLSQFSISPEYKYWFNMPFFGHYLGANAKYISYDMFWNTNKFEGNVMSLGVTYGYCFIIGKKWNIVPNIGLGAGADFSAQGVELVPLITKFGLNLQMVVR